MAAKPRAGQDLLEDARVQAFISTVKAQCKKCNVRLVFANSHGVGRQGKGDCWGFFQEPITNTSRLDTRHTAGILKIAIKDLPVTEWICTLAHEYAHFLQWFRDDPVYSLADEEYVRMEIATEKEAITILKRFRIPIDFDVARRKSKVYIAKIRKQAKPKE